ncbi:MAG: hypothetical protein AAF391_03935 [Bacteroidota bacterium]
MKRLLIFILIGSSISAFTQEGQFSQFYASNSILNPAFIGTNPKFLF